MRKITPFDQWLNSAPPEVQALAKKYPPGKYKLAKVVPEKPPYTYIAPDAKVEIEGYALDGTVLIQVRPEDKTIARLIFERGASEAEKKIDPEHYNAVSYNVETRYLLPNKRK